MVDRDRCINILGCLLPDRAAKTLAIRVHHQASSHGSTAAIELGILTDDRQRSVPEIIFSRPFLKFIEYAD